MKYCQEITEQICKSLLELKGRVNAAKEAGINYDTFCEWMKKPEFSEAIKKAESQANTKGKDVAIMSIFNAMPNQWQAAAWWLERKFKTEFSREETLNQNVNDNRERISIDEIISRASALRSREGEAEPILSGKADTRVRPVKRSATRKNM